MQRSIAFDVLGGHASFIPTRSDWQDYTRLLEHFNSDWGNKRGELNQSDAASSSGFRALGGNQTVCCEQTPGFLSESLVGEVMYAVDANAGASIGYGRGMQLPYLGYRGK